MKNILVINGNPKPKSLVRSLALAYADGARQPNHSVSVVHLSDLQFESNLQHGYDKKQALEPDLQGLQDQIQAADHIAFIFPVWWGSVPALFKGVLDRVLLPGFAFKFHKNKPTHEKLLKGKSADLIMTMDAPVWYYHLIYGAPAHKMMVRTVLKFCGIKPKKKVIFSPTNKASEAKREQWHQQVTRLGARLA